jgi:hypothetical protein
MTTLAGAETADAMSFAPFFLNSIPKSGTHLMLQMLEAIPVLNRSESFSAAIYEGLPHQCADHHAKLSGLTPGYYGFGHIYYSHMWSGLLKDLGLRCVFLSRDPRDMVVSLGYFVTEKFPDMYPYNYLTNESSTIRDIIIALITGFKVNELDYPNINEYMSSFLRWMQDENTTTVTFEQLVLNSESRYFALTRIVEAIAGQTMTKMQVVDAVVKMERAIAPQSPTFRRGEIGSWKSEFDEETRSAFKDVAGDLLIRLGYEKDYDW